MSTITKSLSRSGFGGLPTGVRGCLFDLDGVLTRTAELHEQAWKQAFDEYLRYLADHDHLEFIPFSAHDYVRFVDGKPRLNGTRDFLASRHLELPAGAESDPSDRHTVWGLSNRKNDLVAELITTKGVHVYEGSVRYVRAAREAGLATAVVTSSANAERVLAAAGIEDLFDARIDGVVAAERKLTGKPHPDTFCAGAEAIGLAPDAAAVFEDALAGVSAGRAGHFGYVIGVDRTGQGAALKAAGADVVVRDLAELL
ncbi:MAG TPA: beta-phosphoglucomutase family hydrolase [Sporichthyaceae bacterium]